MSDHKRVVLAVQGMTCGGCAEAVKRVIRKSDPQADVTVILDEGRVEALTSADGAVLADAVTKAGYAARIV